MTAPLRQRTTVKGGGSGKAQGRAAPRAFENKILRILCPPSGLASPKTLSTVAMRALRTATWWQQMPPRSRRRTSRDVPDTLKRGEGEGPQGGKESTTLLPNAASRRAAFPTHASPPFPFGLFDLWRGAPGWALADTGAGRYVHSTPHGRKEGAGKPAPPPRTRTRTRTNTHGTPGNRCAVASESNGLQESAEPARHVCVCAH